MAVIKLRNGQDSSGAGRTRLIMPGSSVRFPASLASPLTGNYRIWISASANSNWPSMRAIHAALIEVRNDPMLSSARQSELLARVRNNDHFAQFVARAFPTETVTESLRKDLVGNDVIAAERAMDGLWAEDNPPPDAGDVVAQAITAHVDPPRDDFDFALMDRLLGMASHYNTAEIQQSVARAAAARSEGRVHQVAIRVLDRLQVSGSQPLPQNPAAITANDQAELDALVSLARSLDPQARRIAYRALSKFPANPQAIAALRAGTADTDENARLFVHQSLNLVTPSQK
jgi:hypothetical protein